MDVVAGPPCPCSCHLPGLQAVHVLPCCDASGQGLYVIDEVRDMPREEWDRVAKELQGEHGPELDVGPEVGTPITEEQVDSEEEQNG